MASPSHSSGSEQLTDTQVEGALFARNTFIVTMIGSVLFVAACMVILL